MSSVNLNRQKKLNAQMNEVMDDFDRFEYFFATNWKKIVIAAVLVVVAVAVIVTLQSCAKSRKLAAAEAYDKASDIAQLEAAIAKHGQAPGAVTMRLAALYVDKKDFANARKQLTLASADKDAADVRYRAALNLGYLDEMEGKAADGAKRFESIAKQLREPGSAAYAAEAYASAGRLYLASGKKAEAKAILEAGRSFIKGLPADQQQVANGFVGMINALLANTGK